MKRGTLTNPDFSRGETRCITSYHQYYEITFARHKSLSEVIFYQTCYEFLYLIDDLPPKPWYGGDRYLNAQDFYTLQH